MRKYQYHRETLMKSSFIFSALFLLFSIPLFSQDVIRQQNCTNESISRQADSLRELYTKDGYILVREASMSMEREYEMPVIVPLTQGSWYQYVFIGDISSRL
jgi:hypothetical protein